MNREQAESFVYQSYCKAEAYQSYAAADAEKRHPELTRELLRSKAGTPTVIVTGSKGKGSVANMIAQILQAASCRVGLMTSPHLVNFCERFKVNGQQISDEEFARYMTRIAPEIEEIENRIPREVCISPMGIQADLALTWFHDQHTDYNVCECGKGAQYDDVNNVRHDYAVINRIFLEHTRELGATLEAIAADKAHVITGEQRCIYVADQEPGVLAVIEARAAEYGVLCKVYGRDFRAERIRYTRGGMLCDVVIGEQAWPDIMVPLLGEHQARNCALAMAAALDMLRDAACRPVDARSEDADSASAGAQPGTAESAPSESGSGIPDLATIRRQLAALNWPGRLEVLSSDPFVMLDACINGASCANICDVLHHLGIDAATVIIGIPDDKDYAGVVRGMQPVAARTILSRSQNPHYHFTDEQVRVMAREGIATTWTNSLDEAIALGKAAGDPILILGTTSVVSEVKRCHTW